MKKVAADLPYACVGGRTRGEQLVIRGDILQVFESISRFMPITVVVCLQSYCSSCCDGSRDGLCSSLGLLVSATTVSVNKQQQCVHVREERVNGERLGKDKPIFLSTTTRSRTTT